MHSEALSYFAKMAPRSIHAQRGMVYVGQCLEDMPTVQLKIDISWAKCVSAEVCLHRFSINFQVLYRILPKCNMVRYILFLVANICGAVFAEVASLDERGIA